MHKSIAASGSFKKISESDLKKTMRKVRSSCTWYKIQDNSVSIKKESKDNWIVGHRRDSFTQILNDLSQISQLPDVEFIVDMGDKLSSNVPDNVPVFAYCRQEGQPGFLVPDSEFTQYSRRCEQVEKLGAQIAYKNKIPKLIWRGSTSGGDWDLQTIVNAPRYKLVKVGIENSEIIDAYFNTCCQHLGVLRKQLTKSGYIKDSLSVEEQMKYKYQILVDGNSATWCRTYWQLFSNALIFKQKSTWVLPVHYGLKPGIHYIELQNDLSDVVDKLNWAMEHDDEVKVIVQNALDFAKDNITYNHMLAYTYLVLLEYKKYWN